MTRTFATLQSGDGSGEVFGKRLPILSLFGFADQNFNASALFNCVLMEL